MNPILRRVAFAFALQNPAGALSHARVKILHCHLVVIRIIRFTCCNEGTFALRFCTHDETEHRNPDISFFHKRVRATIAAVGFVVDAG